MGSQSIRVSIDKYQERDENNWCHFRATIREDGTTGEGGVLTDSRGVRASIEISEKVSLFCLLPQHPYGLCDTIGSTYRRSQDWAEHYSDDPDGVRVRAEAFIELFIKYYENLIIKAAKERCEELNDESVIEDMDEDDVVDELTSIKEDLGEREDTNEERLKMLAESLYILEQDLKTVFQDDMDSSKALTTMAGEVAEAFDETHNEGFLSESDRRYRHGKRNYDLALMLLKKLEKMLGDQSKEE